MAVVSQKALATLATTHIVVFRRRRRRRAHTPAILAACHSGREKRFACFSISVYACGSVTIVMVLRWGHLWAPGDPPLCRLKVYDCSFFDTHFFIFLLFSFLFLFVFSFSLSTAKSYGWTSWSGWTPCDDDCYRTRERYCYHSGNMQSCGGNVNAYGVETDQQKCPPSICPGNDVGD